MVFSKGYNLSPIADLPYIVGAIRLTHVIIPGNVTSMTAVVELYDQTAAVVRATASYDLTKLPVTEQFWLTCAALLKGQSWVATNSLRLRIRWIAVSNAAGGSAVVRLGEPEMHQSYTPDPIPYTPALSNWSPTQVWSLIPASASTVLAANTTGISNRYAIEIRSDGAIYWGDGTNPADSRLYWSAAKTLTFDDGAAGALTKISLAGALLKVGGLTSGCGSSTTARAGSRWRCSRRLSGPVARSR
jgi:hypothetical protein